MGPIDAPLFKLLSARMDWLSQRQAVLTQNIANADTPDYVPKDLRKGDFEALVAGFAGRPGRISIAQTDGAHMDGRAATRLGLAGQEQRTTYEIAPDGNAVILEEQSAKAAQTALDYQLASGLYRKYVGLVRTALGTGQG